MNTAVPPTSDATGANEGLLSGCPICTAATKDGYTSPTSSAGQASLGDLSREQRS